MVEGKIRNADRGSYSLYKTGKSKSIRHYLYPMSAHKIYMEQCFALAEKAAAEGESPVGCVIVKNGVVIGTAYEKSRQLKDITRHAETLAVLDALQHTTDLSGSVLYTNVEPCILCSYVIRHYKIGEVVFASRSGELGGTHKPFNILTTDALKSWTEPPKVTVFNEN